MICRIGFGTQLVPLQIAEGVEALEPGVEGAKCARSALGRSRCSANAHAG